MTVLPPTEFQESIFVIYPMGHDGHMGSPFTTHYFTLEDAEQFVSQWGYPDYSDGTLITYNIVEYLNPPF